MLVRPSFSLTIFFFSSGLSEEAKTGSGSAGTSLSRDSKTLAVALLAPEPDR